MFDFVQAYSHNNLKWNFIFTCLSDIWLNYFIQKRITPHTSLLSITIFLILLYFHSNSLFSATAFFFVPLYKRQYIKTMYIYWINEERWSRWRNAMEIENNWVVMSDHFSNFFIFGALNLYLVMWCRTRIWRVGRIPIFF